MKLFYWITAILFFAGMAQGQVPEKRYAEMLWDSKMYPEALDYYVRLARYEKDDPVINYRVAFCYNYISEGHKALPYIKKSMKVMPQPNDKQYHELARAYHLTHQFDEAIKYYQLSDKDKSNALEQRLRINECELGKKLMRDSVNVTIKNLGPNVNGVAHDILPKITADYSTLYFTSHRTTAHNKGMSPEDVFRSEYINGNWTKAVRVPEPISTKINDACIGISADGQTMFVFKSSNNGDIFISYLDGEMWSEPEPLPVNSPQRETSACISPDGNTIYFVRQNKVNSDIYFVEKMPSGNWTTPKRLSSVINSAMDEESPYMHPDGKTLYFSSRGHGTMGGYDVFKSIKTDTGWTTPVNLGYPINTAGDDWGFVLSADGREGFYASVKQHGLGKQDIYSLTFHQPENTNLTLLKGIVKDEKGNPLKAEIYITSLSDNKLISRINSNKSTGAYLVSLPKGKDYGVQVITEDGLIVSKHFSLEMAAGYNELVLDVEVKQIASGASFVLENILFATGKAELNPASYLELDELVKMLLQKKELKIEIGGHTDNVGDASANQLLSEQRAKAVFDYLKLKQIATERLSFKGYGQTKPLRDNSSEENRAKNRRVEILIK